MHFISVEQSTDTQGVCFLFLSENIPFLYHQVKIHYMSFQTVAEGKSFTYTSLQFAG